MFCFSIINYNKSKMKSNADYIIRILSYLYKQNQDKSEPKVFGAIKYFKSFLEVEDMSDNAFDLQLNRLIDMKCITEKRFMGISRTYEITARGIQVYYLVFRTREKSFKNWDDDKSTQVFLRPFEQSRAIIKGEYKQIKVEVASGIAKLFLKGRNGFRHDVIIKEKEEPYIGDLSHYRSFHFESQKGAVLYYEID